MVIQLEIRREEVEVIEEESDDSDLEETSESSSNISLNNEDITSEGSSDQSFISLGDHF